jgi:O-antigen biosynthesis protein
LEERKGGGLFCDALDRLAHHASGFTVTFLGRPAMVDGRNGAEYVRERARRWPFRWQALTDRDHHAALRYLREGGRLAIIPSLGDNSPHTVLECLCGRIPFLASRVGGIPELIASDDLDRVTFAPRADDLASRLSRAIAQGVPIARPAVDPRVNVRQWIAWHDALASRSASRCEIATPASAVRETPRVSVCLMYQRPAAAACPRDRLVGGAGLAEFRSGLDRSKSGRCCERIGRGRHRTGSPCTAVFAKRAGS